MSRWFHIVEITALIRHLKTAQRALGCKRGRRCGLHIGVLPAIVEPHLSLGTGESAIR